MDLSNHCVDSIQIKLIWTFLPVDRMSPSFAHGHIMGMPMGVISATGILKMPELSNNWADSLQI